MLGSRLGRWIAVLLAFGLLAAACSGESTDDASDDTEDVAADTGETDTGGGTDTGETDTGGGTDTGGAGGGEVYDDPRGGVFAEFQTGFDRSHPFGGLDAFCAPHDEATDRQDTEPGITADTIEIHQIRQQLENLIDIGFGIDVGDVNLMFDTFAAVINEECGGIRGRQISMTESSYDPLNSDVEQARITNCITATEDNLAAVVLNSTGFQGTATLCVAEEHNTPLLTTQGLSDEFMARGDGKLLTLDFSLNESLRFMVERLDAEGELEGKTIAVVGADVPGQPEAVQDGLVGTLEDLGYEVPVNDVIGCGGGATCTEGNAESVTNLKDAGVDAVFPTLSVTSLPGYINEMVTQGFAPGDVQFFNSNFASQAGDLVSSKVAAFGGEAAGALYDRTIIVDAAAAGNFRLEGAQVPAFNQLCLDVYAERTGVEYDWFQEEGNTPAGMVANVCSLVRMAARAIYDAGDNPTRDDIAAALAGLGAVDTNNMIPASIGDGKYTLADAVQTMTWTFPCGIEGAAFDENDTCIVMDDNYELVSR